MGIWFATSHDVAVRTALAAVLGLVAAGGNLLGGYFVIHKAWPRKYLQYFLALGAGYMLGVALVDIIPESVHLAGEGALLYVLIGYFLVHLFEHTIAPHFHFGDEEECQETGEHHHHPRANTTVLLGLAIHTFFDGVAIASGVLVSTWLGGVIFLAVFLHKLPEGSTVASLMLASGQSRRIALLSSAALGGATLAGVGLMYLLRGAVGVALPFSAGVTVYVAASDLIPEVNREPSFGMPLLVFLGVLAMLLLKLSFHL